MSCAQTTVMLNTPGQNPWYERPNFQPCVVPLEAWTTALPTTMLISHGIQFEERYSPILCTTETG
jgi:hypothetical protein